MANKESLFAGLHILMRAILMAQRTLAAGFADTGIEKAAAKSASAGKYKISVIPVILSNFSSCSSYLRGEKISEISVNPWLINDLRSTKVYVRKNKLFLQNKANFRKVKLNVNEVLTRGYVQMDTWSIRKTKPIKANQSQLKPIKANQSQFQSQKIAFWVIFVALGKIS